MNGDTHELWVDGKMVASLEERPRYCNRGRWTARIHAPVCISDADPWPRYYFSLWIGKHESKCWLMAHGIDLSAATWKFKSAQEIAGGPVVDMDELIATGAMKVVGEQSISPQMETDEHG